MQHVSETGWRGQRQTLPKLSMAVTRPEEGDMPAAGVKFILEQKCWSVLHMHCHYKR